MSRLLTNINRFHTANQIYESVTESSNSVYYVFVGDHYEHSNSEVQPLYDNTRMKLDAYRNMIFGKRVEPNDVRLLIRNIPYVSNTVYAMYDDANTTFLENDYYVVVNATSWYHVFKCLDNNNGNTSTDEPNFAHITGSNTYVYETSDGYRWKYMYSVDSSNTVKFETDDYFPYIPNTTVQSTVQVGSIDVIKVEGEGRGYDNYVYGTFSNTQIRLGGDSTLYEIGNTIASTSNGFYTGCLIYLSGGTGSGQYREISNSYANNSGIYFIINSEFSISPTQGTEYQITPKVEIVGDGKQTVNAVARALVNSLSSNSIWRVEMLDRGLGYKYHTANVVANAVVNVLSQAIVRPIYSPLEGHGSNPLIELGCNTISMVIEIANNESNTITLNNQIQQIGLLKDPVFANVEIEKLTPNGEFTTGEQIMKFSPVRLNTNATTNSSLTTVECSGADFENQFTVGEYIYLRSGNTTHHQLALVNSITNSSQIVLNTNSNFSCTETMIYQPNVSSNAYVTFSNSTVIRVSNVNGLFSSNDYFIGVQSGSTSYVNTISRNDQEKTFETFTQLHKYRVTVISGDFEENEVIYQGNLSIANAFLHSAEANTGNFLIYTSNQVGNFTVGNNVIGNTSGAVAEIVEIYEPELVVGSGEILYIENIKPIVRSEKTQETFRFIFEY